HVTILGAIVIGSLLAFLFYNVVSRRQKIFMGDSGSMVIGFVLATLAIRFMEATPPEAVDQLQMPMISAPAVVVGILIVPVIDTLRVFFLRLSRGNSPFVADKNHIHHRLLTLGFSHIQVAFILGGINVLFIVVSFLLMNLGMLKLMAINLVSGFIIFYLPAVFIKLKARNIRKNNARI
ncbi:MAG: MraY family glycosyltransferase, partial [Marinilabiliaceae bacterium]